MLQKAKGKMLEQYKTDKNKHQGSISGTLTNCESEQSHYLVNKYLFVILCYFTNNMEIYCARSPIIVHATISDISYSLIKYVKYFHFVYRI